MPGRINSSNGPGPFATALTGAAQGRAALLLVESLIHGLIARSILSVQEAMDIIEIAADVERQLEEDRNGPTANFQSALMPLSRSIATDLSG